MQTAPRGAADPGTKDVQVVVDKRTRARRSPRPITLAIAALVAVLSFGVMTAVLTGNWPPGRTEALTLPTPVSVYVNELQVETVGEPKRQGDQWIVRVRATNMVNMPVAPQGTVTRDSPTPALEPVDLRNATVKVLFFDKPSSDATRLIVGSAVGNVTNLPFGKSKEIDVVATGLGEFCTGCYEVFPATIWTTKDFTDATTTPSP